MPLVNPVETFFYGLFMDAQLLRDKGLRAEEPRLARLDEYRLRLGTRARLTRDRDHAVHGILLRVPEEDLRRLYSDPSVSAYLPVSVEVVLGDGTRVAATCYNLPESSADSGVDVTYARKLHDLGTRLGLPPEYLATIWEAPRDGCN